MLVGFLYLFFLNFFRKVNFLLIVGDIKRNINLNGGSLLFGVYIIWIKFLVVGYIFLFK